MSCHVSGETINMKRLVDFYFQNKGLAERDNSQQQRNTIRILDGLQQ